MPLGGYKCAGGGYRGAQSQSNIRDSAILCFSINSNPNILKLAGTSYNQHET